jgi:hypothetical protein
MNTSTTISQGFQDQRRSRAHIWAAIAGSVHVGIYLVPVRIVSLSSHASLLPPYLIVSVPAVWSIFMLLRYRTKGERIVAWISLLLSVIWFALVGSIRT